MGRKASSGSPLERAAGAAGPHTVEALKLLGDETRLAILLALWEAYDPQRGVGSLAFSDLREAVGAPDSGNFAYHLDKLAGRFVDEHEAGYALSNAGHRVVRSVIAGTGLEEARLEATGIPRSCPTCGDPLEITYRDQRLYQRCSECEGSLGPSSPLRAPEGTVTVHDGFEPAGLAGRTPEEVFVAGTIDQTLALALVVRGVCPECTAATESSVSVCEDHAPSASEPCPACGTRDEVRVRYVCSVCKFDVSYPAWCVTLNHPASLAFYHDHGYEGTHAIEDAEDAARLWTRWRRGQQLVSRDPLRIRVEIEDEGEVLALTLDEELDVIDVDREPADPPRPRHGGRGRP
jgi:DNA-binding transcriptional ArsR family regulator